jgi:putative tryptophan/tyrosine transport system substrate-binding protein
MLPDPLRRSQVRAVVARATEHRLPTPFLYWKDLKDGALLVYGIDSFAVWRQAACYIDHLLRGAKVGDLLFDQPF